MHSLWFGLLWLLAAVRTFPKMMFIYILIDAAQRQASVLFLAQEVNSRREPIADWLQSIKSRTRNKQVLVFTVRARKRLHALLPVVEPCKNLKELLCILVGIVLADYKNRHLFIWVSQVLFLDVIDAIFSPKLSHDWSECTCRAIKFLHFSHIRSPLR